MDDTDKTNADLAPFDVDYAILSGAVGYCLRRAQQAVLQDFNLAFQRENVRPAEFSTLQVLSHNPGMRQCEVAEALGIQRANFVVLVDGLARRALIERRKSQADRRVQSLYLTAEGEAFVTHLSAIWREHEDRIVARLGGAAARDQLVGLLTRLSG